MSYAIRKDGLGWRAVNSADDVGPDEIFSEYQPAPIHAPRDIKAEISALEFATLTGRGTREFMLSYFEANFTPEQLAANPGYVKAKALDNHIKLLRELL